MQIKLLKCWSSQVAQCRNFAKLKVVQDAMKYLNVAEKNDAAKTIAGLLSNGTAQRREGYSVYNKIYDFETNVRGNKAKMVMTSVSGHLLRLEFLSSYRNWRVIDPRALFDAPVRKACSDDFQPIKRTLEREIRGCQGLIIWTDCDREGENIGFEIIEVCRAIKPNIPVHRAIFSEITTAAVRRALQQLSTPDKRQSDAVDVRTELDLRTGAAITRFQTMRLQRLFPEKIADKLISYGSCQIPTLGFVAERYKEIEAFVSEPFWKIKVIHTIEDLTVEFLWARNRLFDKNACEDYLLLCLAEPKATVEVVTVKPKHKWRPTPLDTVDMEKLGSRKLKLSAKETMTIAEKLYTKGIISYPRTETNQFSKEFELAPLVEQQTTHSVWGEFAKRVMQWGPNPRNGNKSDQAHPPIHPTKLVTDLQGNEARVYEMIVRHFLACVSKDAVGSETVVHINIAGEKFTATGLCIYERNYLDVYIYDKWNAKQIHKYEQGQVFDPTEITMPEGATTAPPLLTEADLIALMDKHGIGTDATHAEHINTIKERGYIGVVDKGALVPGVIGMGLYEGYDAMELVLAKPLLRAEFEADLKRICLGEKQPKDVLSDQIRKYKEAYQQIMEKITAMDAKFAQRIQETPAVAVVDANGTTASASSAGASVSDWENNPNRVREMFQCPKCNVAPLALKAKKNQSGHFIGCLNYPDCRNCIWLPDECKEPTVLDEHCPKCGEGFKMLKFKLASSYYRTIFNAPHGWYKTCLRCDAQFRNNFDINLDCVKRVGAIVADVPPATATISTNRAGSTNNAAGNSTSNLASHSRGNSTVPGRGGKTAKSKKPVARDETQTTQDKPKRAAKTTTTTKQKKSTQTGTNIRNFFTSSRSNASSSTAALVAEQLHDVPLSEFFDSNDGFDQLLVNATERATNTAAVAVGFNEDIAAAFAAADDDDFADLDLNTVTGAPPPPSPPRLRVSLGSQPSTSANARAAHDASFGSVCRAFEQDDDADINNFVWGTKARASLNTGETPLAKKPRLAQLSNTIQQPRFYDEHEDDGYNATTEQVAWGSRAPNATAASSPETKSSVLCTGCHQSAKSCIVRREGPNQNRPFYVCPQSKACKFFQWADEQRSTNASGSSLHAKSNATAEPNSSTARAQTNQSHETASTESAVECGCGKPASRLTVRKPGPNTGRPFFACSNRDKSCGFFKWADDDEQAGTSTFAWGSAARRTSEESNAGTARRDGTGKAAKPRKCGLCRQEGHTRAKCPRKSEFEC